MNTKESDLTSQLNGSAAKPTLTKRRNQRRTYGSKHKHYNNKHEKHTRKH